MGEELKFNRNEDNTIGFSFVEKVKRTGTMSEEEFKNKYDTTLKERDILEKQLVALNVKRMEYDEQLNSYEAFMDSESELKEEEQEEE